MQKNFNCFQKIKRISPQIKILPLHSGVQWLLHGRNFDKMNCLYILQSNVTRRQGFIMRIYSLADQTVTWLLAFWIFGSIHLSLQGKKKGDNFNAIGKRENTIKIKDHSNVQKAISQIPQILKFFKENKLERKAHTDLEKT